MKNVMYILFLIICFSCISENNLENTDNNDAVIRIDSISMLNKEDRIVREKIKQLQERFYHITLLKSGKEKDTIVNLDFLEADQTSDFIFNYEPFEKRIYTDTLSMFRTNMEVGVVKSNFDKTKSIIKYDKDSLNVIYIDNHGVFGTNRIPQSYISHIYLNLSGHSVEIDKEHFEDLYEPDFNKVMAYYYDKELIIRMSNSDGYLRYNVVFFIDNELNIKRIVYQS